MVDLLYTTPQLLNLLYQLYYTTPLITEPTVHFPLITMYTVMDYIQEHSKTTKQQNSAWPGHT